MGFLSDVLGTKNEYQAKPVSIQQGATVPQIGQVFGQGQGVQGWQQQMAQQLAAQQGIGKQGMAWNQQQGLANALGGGAGNLQSVFGQQQDLANALQQQAMGQGPNPALEQLRQTTGQNIQQATGMLASQKGMNPAMAARLAGQTAAGTNQQAAGQAATLAAQQQLAARGLQQQQLQGMGGLAGAQVGQQLEALQGMGGLAGQMTGQQMGMLGTMGGQNLQQQQILQQALAQYNAQNVGQNLGISQINAGVSGQNAGINAGLVGGLLNAGGAAMGMPGKPPGAAHGGVIGMDDGGTVPGSPATGPQSQLGKSMAGALGTGFAQASKASVSAPVLAMPRVTGIPTFESEGGNVPGRAMIAGDSEENDTVPIMASPGEAVIPRSAMADPDAAHAFLDELLRQHKRQSYADGGLVDAFMNWVKGGKSEEESKGVAEEVSKKMPSAVMPRGAIEKKRKQLADLDVQTRD